MTYEQATHKSEELLAQALELAEKHGATGGDKWAFVAGCLKADIRLLLAGTHTILNK